MLILYDELLSFENFWFLEVIVRGIVKWLVEGKTGENFYKKNLFFNIYN